MQTNKLKELKHKHQLKEALTPDEIDWLIHNLEESWVMLVKCAVPLHLVANDIAEYGDIKELHESINKEILEVSYTLKKFISA